MTSRNRLINRPQGKTSPIDRTLKSTAAVWFALAVIGQWIFAFYVASFYGGAAIEGDFMKWNRVLPHGYAEGETMSNLAVGIHLFFAIIILIGGPLQFIPQIRNRFRSFHRLNGRIYFITVILVSLSGIYMVITKGTISGLVGDISVSLNGVLIFICAILAWRKATTRNFVAHSRWAFRLFLVASGVWFFRIGLMFWLFAVGPVGLDLETFRGPFLVFLGFAQYLLPLAIYEAYRLSRTSKYLLGSYGTLAVLYLCILITALGTFAATTGMWLPRIGN